MTVKRVPALRTVINVPPFEGVFRKRNPLVPTALDTITTSLSSFFSSLGGSAGTESVLGIDGSLGVGVVVGAEGVSGVDTGGSLTGKGVGSVVGTGAGVVSGTCS